MDLQHTAMGPELPPIVETLLTLPQAAKRCQWSVRTLKAKLRSHGIGTISSGKTARITERDLAQLIDAERQPTEKASTLQLTTRPHSMREIARRLRLDAEIKAERTGGQGPAFDAPMQSYWRRRNAQMNRKKPPPK